MQHGGESMIKDNVAPTSPVEVVRVTVRRDRNGWHEARSSDLPGLYVANPDVSAVFEDVPITIKALYKAQFGVEVEVIEGAYREARDAHDYPWLTVPTGSAATQFTA